MSKTSAILSALALAAVAARGADAGFTLGVPGAPVLKNTASTNDKKWRSSNALYTAMAVVAPGWDVATHAAPSLQAVPGEETVKRAAAEAGFAIERTKPEY